MAEYTKYTVTAKRVRRRWVTIVQWVGLVAVIAVSFGAGTAFGWLQRTVAEVERNDPVAVSETKPHLTTALKGEPVTILVMGSDRREKSKVDPQDKGRSDSLLVMRLDPHTRSISMLSIPRDLRVDIPGYGIDKINAAYTIGGPSLTVQTVAELTGLKINDFVDINFLGFVDIVDKLGGAFMMVDHRYYNPPNSGSMAIDLLPGYQRLDGQQALSFVRFRHDQQGDFTRMVRQQTFLKEMKRQLSQSARWQNWRQLFGIIKTFAKHTVSDIASLNKLYDMASLVLKLDTSRVYQVHIEGGTPTIGGVSYVEATPTDVQAAVQQFLHPVKAVPPPVAPKLPIDSFTVTVLNGSGRANIAGTTAAQLRAKGYRAVVGGNAYPFDYADTVIFTTKSFVGYAQRLAALLQTTKIRVVPHGDSTIEGISVILGSAYGGQLVEPQSGAASQQIVYHSPQDVASWRALKAQTPIKLSMPTVWASGLGYDEFRAYTTPTGQGGRAAAVVVVGTTADGSYWDVQALHWKNPPAIAHPDAVRAIKGRAYMLFYNGAHLHMVAWRAGDTVYWVNNTLDDQGLSNDLMLALATSFKPVK